MFFNKKAEHKYVIHTYGSPVLRKQAEPVTVVNEKIRQIAREMKEALRIFDGIGLAAPQIGLSIKMVAFEVPFESMKKSGMPPTPGEVLLLPRMPMVVINPEIIGYGDETGFADEGCLSVPGLYAEVERPLTVTFKASTLDGEEITCECGGLFGRCIQHELDHLAGRLFIDRLDADELRRVKPKLRRLEKNGRKNDFMRQV